MERAVVDWIDFVANRHGLDGDYIKKYISQIEPISDIHCTDDFYVVSITSKDILGNECLYVLSCATKKPSVKSLLKMEQYITALAKSKKVRYIYQGEHLNRGYGAFLERLGYKKQTFVKELKWE